MCDRRLQAVVLEYSKLPSIFHYAEGRKRALYAVEKQYNVAVRREQVPGLVVVAGSKSAVEEACEHFAGLPNFVSKVRVVCFLLNGRP